MKEERERGTQMAGKRVTEKRRGSCHPPFPPPSFGSVGTAMLWRGEIAKARPRVACMDAVVTSILLTSSEWRRQHRDAVI